MVAVAIVFWLSLSLSGPFHLRLWGAMYPSRLRGRDRRGRWAWAGPRPVAIAVAGRRHRRRPARRPDRGRPRRRRRARRAPSRTPGSGRRPPPRRRLLGARLHPRPARAPASSPGRARPGLLRRRPDRGHPALRPRLRGPPGPHAGRRRGHRVCSAAVATTVAFLAWGAVTDRWGALVAMRVGSLLGLASLLAVAVAPGLGVPLVRGDRRRHRRAPRSMSGSPSVVSDQTSLASRAAAMAGWNAITGARGIVAAFSMSALLQVGHRRTSRSGLLLCAVVSGDRRRAVLPRPGGRCRSRRGRGS